VWQGDLRALRKPESFATGEGSDIAPIPDEAGVVWGIAASRDGRELRYTLPTSGVDLVRLEL
jgi:hypothetical protein